jgi:hypothetical protein
MDIREAQQEHDVFVRYLTRPQTLPVVDCILARVHLMTLHRCRHSIVSIVTVTIGEKEKRGFDMQMRECVQSIEPN